MASNYVDDGAVFYLNGREAGRLRMEGGPVTASTAATVAPEGRVHIAVDGKNNATGYCPLNWEPVLSVVPSPWHGNQFLEGGRSKGKPPRNPARG